MRSQRKWLVALAAVAVLAGGCSDGSGSDDENGEASGSGWTVLHYSMADTDLEPFMVEDVNEMGQVGSQEGLAVRAFVDRSAEYGDDELLDQGAWVGARVLDIGEGTAEVVDDLGDVNSADPETLATFIAEGIEAHPNDHYAVIISDHGASWPGIGPDEGSDDDVLDLAQIRDGIARGIERGGVDKLDLLGFDACLMGSYEVAAAVAPLAHRMVASQELEPGHGWDYASALSTLAEDPGASADTFGRAIIEGFEAQAEEAETSEQITLSLVDLSKMDQVQEAVGALGSALSSRAAAVAPAVGRANAATLGFARSPDETEDSHMKDLGLLASAIGVEALDVSKQADAVERAVNDAVVASVNGSATRGATGLSIYFPPHAEVARGDYRDVETASAWSEFLASFYAAGEAIPAEEQPQFVEADDAVDVTFDEDGVTMTAGYAEQSQDNLTEAVISYAIVEADGSLTYLGEEEAEVDADGAPVATGFYDLTRLEITDGEDTAIAYVALEVDEEAESFTVDVPMAYYAADDVDGETYQDVLLSLSIDAESGDVLSETYYAYDEASETYGELTADPEGIIVPEVLTLSAEGDEEWTATSDVGLYAELENLQYEFASLESGTQLQLDLTVVDYGDNSDTASVRVQVP